jgi:hypothetical protein
LKAAVPVPDTTMSASSTALENLLQTNHGIRSGGLREVLQTIDEEIGLPVRPSIFRCEFEPTATRWDGPARTVHLYEISSSEAFPDGTFDAIRDFAERLHDGAGCFTAMWIADGNGCDPMKVWDVRDELIWVR